jgi:tight adherence protein B
VGLLLLGPAGGLTGALVVVSVWRRRGRRRAAAAVAAASDQLGAALGRMVDELRAGQHPAVVLDGGRADGPLAAELLAAAATAAALGDRVADALRRTAVERVDVGADLERVALAWAVAERHGVPLADLLARTQHDIRWRMRFGAAVRAQLAGPRATASVLTALPALGLGLGQLVGADPVGVLRGGLWGQALLVLGVGLAAAGMAWSEQILRAAVPR